MTVPQEITQRDLRGRSGEIMDAVEHGDQFIVTRGGTPIGELIPLRRRRTVTREQFAAMSENAPVIDVRWFRESLEQAMAFEAHDPYER